jgi:hypothetical protein
MIAPHCNGGAARQDGIPFLWVTKLTTSRQVGARGGNVLLLDGSVHWRNTKQMTNYTASQFGGGYWNAWCQRPLSGPGERFPTCRISDHAAPRPSAFAGCRSLC